MAFTVEDLGDLLALLRQHPEWRDAVRREVLTNELLGLPATMERLAADVERLAQAQERQALAHERLTTRVDSLAAQVERLTTRVDSLAAQVERLTTRVDSLAAQVERLTTRVDSLAAQVERLTTRVDSLAAEVERLTTRVDSLAARVDSLAAEVERLAGQVGELGRIVGTLDGRVGNLEGWRYERQFNARARITEILRRPVEVDLAELDPVLDARDSGRLTEREWKQLLALNFLFRGRLGAGPEAPERLLALEVSQVVDARDVQRAHDRAGILARIGFDAIAAVGGNRVTADAAQLANRLGVRTLTTSTDES